MSIVIAGYYGFGNVGDELILFSLVQQFRKADPSVRLTVLSNHPITTAEANSVNAVHRWHPWTWILPLVRADRFLLGGGGLLQESSGPWNYAYYLSLVLMAKLFGCKTELVALGVDPIHSPINRFWTRFVLHHWTDSVSVRDEESRLALKEAGVHKSITVVPDPVLDLWVPSARSRATKVALVLSKSSDGNPSAGELAGLCTHISDKLKCGVDLLVFFPAEDLPVSEIVAGNAKAVDKVRMANDPKDLLNWIADYRLVISFRFHAVVLAQRAGVSFIGCGQQPKTEHFCQSHRAPFFSTDKPWREDEIMAQVKLLYSHREQVDFPHQYEKPEKRFQPQ